MKKIARKINAYIISTAGYKGKFIEVRQKIFDLITDMGMNPIGYERDDYAITPGTTVGENCLNNMQAADLFLILLNERYGFVESGNTKSITHKEVERALESGKPCIVFAQDQLFKLINMDSKSPNFDKQKHKIFGSDIRHGNKLLRLLKNAMKRVTICQYPRNASEVIVNLVQEKINALAPYFIGELVKKQCEHVAGLFNNETFGLNNQKVPLLFRIHGKPSKEAKNVPVLNHLGSGSVIIEGDSGSGKSFVLRESFVKFASDYLKKELWGFNKVPVYLEFRSYKKSTFNYRNYIKELFKEFLSYEIPNFILNRIKQQGVVVFADAIDEWKYSSQHDDLMKMIKSINTPFVLSSRSSTYNRISTSIFALNKPCTTITINGWSEKSFVKYAEALGPERAKSLINIYDVCEKRTQPTAQDSTKKRYSPFISSILINHLANDDIDIRRITSIGCLFREATESCIKKEMIRRDVAVTEEVLEKIKLYLSQVCMFVHLAKFLTKESSSKRDLEGYLIESGVSIDNNIKDIIFPVFFTVEDNSFYPKHMLIVYYYAAEEIVKLLRGYDYGFFIKYPINSETNRMVGDFCAEISESELSSILHRLCNYSRALNDDVPKLMMYYLIPRIAEKTNSIRDDVVKYLKGLLLIEHGIARIAILNWLVQFGDVSAEQEYYNLITNDRSFSNLNRGSYLIYQQDRPDELFGFDDMDDNIEWQATARSFVEHFESKELRHLLIRRTDIATMLSFIKTGKKIYPFFSQYFLNLTSEDFLRNSFNIDVDNFLLSKGIDVNDRKKELLELFETLKKEICKSM